MSEALGTQSPPWQPRGHSVSVPAAPAAVTSCAPATSQLIALHSHKGICTQNPASACLVPHRGFLWDPLLASSSPPPWVGCAVFVQPCCLFGCAPLCVSGSASFSKVCSWPGVCVTANMWVLICLTPPKHLWVSPCSQLCCGSCSVPRLRNTCAYSSIQKADFSKDCFPFLLKHHH